MNDDERTSEIIRGRLRQVAKLVDGAAPNLPLAPWDKAERGRDPSRRGFLRTGRAVGSLSAVAIVVVVVGAAAVSWQLRENGRIASNPSASGRPTPTAALQTANPSSSRPTAVGWPISTSNVTGEQIGVFAPDGSFYVAGDKQIFGYDASGHLLNGWPVSSPIGGAALAIAIAPDGSLVVASKREVADIGPTGQVRQGWPIQLTDNFSGVFVGKQGFVVVAEALVGGQSRVLGFKPGSANPIAWSRQVPGAVWDVAFAGDSTVILKLNTGQGGQTAGFTVQALNADGQPLAGWPTAGWNGMAVSPSGNVALWSYDTKSVASGSVEVIRTHLTVLDRAGHAITGWPKVLVGAASAPVFGPDGSLYVTSGAPGGSGTGSIVAFDGSGRPKSGWPAPMPTGFSGVPVSVLTGQPLAPQPPVLGNGVLYVAGESSGRYLVAAFDLSGTKLPGWPYVLPAGNTFADLGNGTPGGPPESPRVAASGSVFFLAITPQGGSVIALDSHGSVRSGWPQTYAYTPKTWLVLDGGGVGLFDGTIATGWLPNGATAP